ncbi:MAG: hypothetical protein A2161_03245 [Candidatus Schekmanbacteria bacterium RBG_13_48_7]|uniref:Cas10/Cmr2 second palm domain-containing protein n=1 Tax=Candidatus Schekmanbacteria bacterium RBG_13_48_7 TaxID=1817878 RepID=A0A1F7RTZ1_9BACT|nr:MAG: hypothetical protein A2161_03245 [Candidatus Schekmanbacteria bacterium RBG_13_48_7]
MSFIAAIDIDQVQRFIFKADKLKEMLGASELIKKSLEITQSECDKPGSGVELIWPVSGTLKLRSDDLHKLAKFLWTIRENLFSQLGLTATFAILEEDNNLTLTYRKITARMRKLKDNKSGEDCLPTSPYFAQCLIQPNLPANHWFPAFWEDDRQRRSLISWISKIRETEKDYVSLIEEWSRFQSKGYKKPSEFKHLIASESDSYIALIKGDGDGMGKLLASLNWDDPSWNDEKPPYRRAYEYAMSIDRCIKESLKNAIKILVPEVPEESEFFPIIPLLAGGEDLWVISRRDIALKFVILLAQEYSKNIEKEPVITKAFEVAGLKSKEKLTISFGVLFAKQGYPFDAQIDLVDELLHSAKQYRRELPLSDLEGCVDFHWLGSTGRETVADCRMESYGYNDKKMIFKLFTRPWSITELERAQKAAAELEFISRRKLKQIETILRMGDVLSQLAFYKWWANLIQDERNHILKVLECLPLRLRIDAAGFVPDTAGSLPLGPWKTGQNDMWSPLIDLLELLEIFRLPKQKRNV